MARYLVVAHQTATSEELLDHLRTVASGDPAAEFMLLVPVTPIDRLLTWEEGEALAEAERTALAARRRFGEADLNLVDVHLADSSPLQAIADELHYHARYERIIIGTLPLGASRWLGMDVPRHARARFHLPVTHVETRQKVPAGGKSGQV